MARYGGKLLGVIVVGVSLLALGAGCGTGASTTGPVVDPASEQGQIVALVDKFADFTNNLKSFRSLYCKDAQPSKADMVKMKDAFIYASKENLPQINGDSATIPLTSEDTNGDPKQVEWTAVKEDGVWKLDKTPI